MLHALHCVTSDSRLPTTVIVLALVMFCIANMPGNQAFGSRGTVVEGLFSTFVLAWQISIIGDFEMENYNTVRNQLGTACSLWQDSV